MSVVLPAPLVPMSPTISPLRTSIDTWSLAFTPPKATLTPVDLERHLVLGGRSVGATDGGRRERRAVPSTAGSRPSSQW